MSACEFNLSRYAERLEGASVPREQALAHAELTAEVLQNLVTKDQLRSELAALEDRLRAFVRDEIAASEGRISEKFAAFEARLEERLDARFAAFEARIEVRLAKMQAELFRWLFIAVFIQGGFILACLKLLN